MALDVIYPGKYFVCAWEEYVFCCCWMEWYTNVSKVQWSISLSPLSSLLLYWCSVGCAVIENGVLKSPTTVALLSNCLKFGQCLLYMFRCLLLEVSIILSVIYHNLVMNWFCYYYKISFFIFCKKFLTSTLFCLSIATFGFFIIICMHIFSVPSLWAYVYS